MAYGDLVSRVDFDMKRDSPFSYACHACNRCCRNKAIRVSPYEILRLARYLGVSTTEFIESHTEAGGTVLRTPARRSCSRRPSDLRRSSPQRGRGSWLLP